MVSFKLSFKVVVGIFIDHAAIPLIIPHFALLVIVLGNREPSRETELNGERCMVVLMAGMTGMTVKLVMAATGRIDPKLHNGGLVLVGTR